MTDRTHPVEAEALVARLLLAYDNADIDAYSLAAEQVLADADLMVDVLAVCVYTLLRHFEVYPEWRERTAAQLIGNLDELAGEMT